MVRSFSAPGTVTTYAEGRLMPFDLSGGVPTGPPHLCLAVAK
jgi:hypothetical protein